MKQSIQQPKHGPLNEEVVYSEMLQTFFDELGRRVLLCGYLVLLKEVVMVNQKQRNVEHHEEGFVREEGRHHKERAFGNRQVLHDLGPQLRDLQLKLRHLNKNLKTSNSKLTTD